MLFIFSGQSIANIFSRPNAMQCCFHKFLVRPNAIFTLLNPLDRV